MKECTRFVILLLCTAGLNLASASKGQVEVTPVQKVIQMMEGMLLKGKKEKHDEQVQYAAYKQFCDDTSAEKKAAIDAATEKIEVLQADIEKLTDDIEVLTKEIADHEEDITVWENDQKAATKVRGLEKADFDALHKDYSESIDALQRAIKVLKEQAYDRKQADGKVKAAKAQESMVQVKALQGMRLIPTEYKRAVDAFLAEDPEGSDSVGLGVSAPEANAYEFQSSGVIQMLVKLLDKFKAERTALEKEEMASVHAYNMLMQDLTNQIDQAKEDVDRKSEAKGRKLEAKATAEGELEETTKSRAEDKKYLDDLVATCEQKATDFESRQQLRTDELEAIAKAIEIISSEAVAGNAETYLPSFVQGGVVAKAFAQLRAERQTEAKQQVVAYLSRQAARLNSKVLAGLAVRVTEDPFKKVKKMIKDLMVRLLEEANQEAEHKGWCDTELATNEHTRKAKTEAVETLKSEIDMLEADIAQLTVDIKELTKAVAEIDRAVQEATELREKEKANNTETVEDAQEAQAAVAQALIVLRTFYEKAAEATALLQQQQEPPPIFDSPYKGMQAESGGVVGMLEVIETDFARLEADTKAAEAASQKEYEEFMSDSKVDKAQKEADIENKEAKKQDDEQALVVKKDDLEATQKELEAALAYFDKLKPSCVAENVSYEDRVARRKEEIESLQEALRILGGSA